MRLTEEQYLELTRRRKAGMAPQVQPVPAKKPPKYRNVRTEVDGIKFDSKLEASFYEHLVMRWRCGGILWFTRQVPFLLEGGVRYVADFLIAEKDGVRIVDTSGIITQVKKNKLRQIKARYGIEVEIVTRAA